MDEIFQESTGLFDVVQVARKTPHRYSKKGEFVDSSSVNKTDRKVGELLTRSEDSGSNGDKGTIEMREAP